MRADRLKSRHQVIRLEGELRTGESSLAQFAADLYGVTLRIGRRPVDEDSEKFFTGAFAPGGAKRWMPSRARTLRWS